MAGILCGKDGICNDTDKIKALYFYSEECDHCQYIDEFVLKPLEKIYPLNVEKINIDKTEGYELLLLMEEITGDRENEIPAIFIGNKGLDGVDEIETELEDIILELLEQNKDMPNIDSSENSGKPLPRPLKKRGHMPDETFKETSKLPVYAAYFSKQGCKECTRAYKDLRYLKSKYPNLVLHVYDISDPNSKTLNEALGEMCKVPEEKRLTTPSLFIGEDYLLGDSIQLSSIENLVKKYSDNPFPPPWERASGFTKEAEKNIIMRFKGLNIPTILTAGLLDGINPCAFATIIFFISYLAYIGRKGNEILLVGLAFTVAVFITYMLIGLGFLSFIKGLSFLPVFSKIVYLATAIFALVLGILSLKDFFLCRSGKISDMSLQLPKFIKKRIHKTIREEAKLKKYILGALMTGFIISILELACTGQVYLPTIIFVSRISTLRIRSILYLFLYNLMFISPLFVIFITVYKGTSSQQLTAFFQRSSALIKLGTALFFFLLAAILFLSIV